MDFRRHWDRWLWLCPAAIILIGAARLFFGREPFCAATADEHCLREWISALGGWLAIAVAVPTVAYLSKQVSDAERFSRINVRLHALPILENAEHIAELAQKLKEASIRAIEVVGADFEPAKYVKNARIQMKVVGLLLDREEFSSASREFHTLHRSEIFSEAMARHVKELTDPANDSATYIDRRRNAYRRQLEMVSSFADALATKSKQKAGIATELINSA
ncbi:hypothetical protein N185_03090 [Sinorhizobium sp. GW3]|nr:hypothetical protein N185_03090 [Sinorhizobium sp. GW3]